MACAGLAANINRAMQSEAPDVRQPWNESTIERAVTAQADAYSPISDRTSSAYYRLRGAQNLLRRFYLETRGELNETVYSYGRHG